MCFYQNDVSARDTNDNNNNHMGSESTSIIPVWMLGASSQESNDTQGLNDIADVIYNSENDFNDDESDDALMNAILSIDAS